MNNLLIAIVIPGFLAALAAPALYRFLPKWAGRLCPLLPLSLFAALLTAVGPVAAGKPITASLPWLPSLGVSFSLYLDGLGMLFALLVTGIGFLVFLYTPAYMGKKRGQGQLNAWLFAFMAAMLGTTLAGNLITLFVFWELTGFCSYMLIGFEHEKESSRTAALQALLITGVGGLALLAGLILLLILAWSTVSALGCPTLLLGMGTPAAVTAAMLFLLTHALYKSSLFLVAAHMIGRAAHQSGVPLWKGSIRDDLAALEKDAPDASFRQPPDFKHT